MAEAIERGIFYDSPVRGLEYRTQTLSGLTDEEGGFRYRAGETAVFSVGGLILGGAVGAGRLTPGDIVIEAGGDVGRIKNNRVTNIARFLQSLNPADNLEEAITITGEIRDIVRKYRRRIDLDRSPQAFTGDADVRALFAELGATLRTPAQAKNHLRRSMYGIKKLADVRIPTRDGSYLLANIFLPVEGGRHPVVMSLGAYGKPFGDGRICDLDDLLAKEDSEDRYFEGNPDEGPWGGVAPWENGEAVNTVDWVPRGYVVMRVDERGVGKTPGMFEQFSYQEAKDYYDAIEWAGAQPWSNGRVGIWGAGYYGMNAWNVAQLQPPSLKAMVAIGADSDSYRDNIFSCGGLYNTFNGVLKNACGEWRGVEWIDIAMANPFNDPAIYGPAGKICISPDLGKIDVPFWGGMGLSGTIHTRGVSEAFIRASSKHKKLTIISETGIHFWAYARKYLEEHLAFFDYWLKDIKSGIIDRPPVDMMVRTGYGGYYWQTENEWPIARTRYARYYLDATPSAWEGDGRRSDFMKLGAEAPLKEASGTYEAGVEWQPETAWAQGISFVSEPMAEDVVLAGYLKLVVWVASTTRDMELHATVRVIDEENNEVEYPVGVFDATTGKNFPIGFGGLKVSHRKTDPAMSTVYRPWHTHLKEDHQPLKPGEPVEAEVEIWPTTALVRKGWRIRLDIGPVCGSGIGLRIHDAIDQTYQAGARNTVLTGPQHPSYLQLPVIPPKNAGD